jgi:hypothetical protein
VQGVTVAIDTVGGERVEVVSDANGEATVELDIADVDGLLAHVDGRSFSSISPGLAGEMVGANQRVLFYSWSLETTQPPPASVTISGALLNKTAPANYAHVTATTAAGQLYNQPNTTNYAIEVPANQDFTLVALEWVTNSPGVCGLDETLFGWALAGHAAVSGPTTVDLDLAMDVVPNEVSGTVAAPVDQKLAEEGKFDLYVFAGEAIAGYAYSCAPTAGNTGYDFSAAYLDVPGQAMVSVFSVRTTDGEWSYVWIREKPSSGDQDIGFLSPPHRTSPTGAGPIPWGTLVSWTLDATSDQAGTVVSYGTESGQIGVVLLRSGDSSFQLPALPSTSSKLAPGPIFGGVALCASTDANTTCEKRAEEAPFEVESPFGG